MDAGDNLYQAILARRSVRRYEKRRLDAETLAQVQAIISEVSTQTGADISLEVFASRRPGGINYQHPLAKAVRRIMSALDIQPRKSPSTSELSAFIDHDIPAITIGITAGEHQNTPEEEVGIEPMFTGLAQLIGILLAIDKGYCSAD